MKKEETLIAKIHRADALVLCKSELFLQKAGGDTIDTVYPCAREIAVLLSELFTKDISFE